MGRMPVCSVRSVGLFAEGGLRVLSNLLIIALDHLDGVRKSLSNDGAENCDNEKDDGFHGYWSVWLVVGYPALYWICIVYHT